VSEWFASVSLPGDFVIPGLVGINEGSRVERPSPFRVVRTAQRVVPRSVSVVPRFTIPELCFAIRFAPVVRRHGRVF
jgi:hypothetical protein